MITVKFYGKLRQLFGEELNIDKKIDTIEDLMNFLEEKNEAIKKLKEHLLFSINRQQAKSHDKIKDGDEIAVFLPPGGG